MLHILQSLKHSHAWGAHNKETAQIKDLGIGAQEQKYLLDEPT